MFTINRWDAPMTCTARRQAVHACPESTPNRPLHTALTGFVRGRHLARGLRTIPQILDQTVSFLVSPGHLPPGVCRSAPACPLPRTPVLRPTSGRPA